jgi:UDP-N-acetylmuramyl pentapeptide phosphotransferase/UDP-N-acetylglucosamine-1-phosphate transferase
MDGIDGIAAMQAAITGVGMAMILVDWGGHRGTMVVAGAISGAAMGFLPHNFPRARIFMGDVGSIPLGFSLASLVIIAAQDCGPGIILPFVALQAGFILDTGITLIRRGAKGEKVWQAHKEHFYQKLARSGLSHIQVTSMMSALDALSVIAVLFLYRRSGEMGRALIIASIVFAWLMLFVYAEKRFRRYQSPG